jgi:Fe-S-cluster containining protein
MPPKITISSLQRYSCILCGRCCRRFHVLLRPPEIERLAAFDWGDEPDVPADFVVTRNGFPYFQRQADGACVFLGRDGACRMHRRFGFDQKALTCRGYPFNIVSTFPGEVSVLARMDCPAVLQNHGTPISEQRQDIEKLVREMQFGDGFSPTQLNGLLRPAVELLTGAARQLLQDTSLNMTDCICCLRGLAERARKLGATFLNDLDTMREIMPSLRRSVQANLEDRPRLGLGAAERAQFRQWLCLYWRRDEEMLDTSLKTRVARAAHTAAAIAGFGNPRHFGQEHPDLPMRQVRLFEPPDRFLADDTAWEPYRRFLEVRLECCQFFGPAYYDTGFFTGLDALCLTYPVTLAAARCHAAACERATVTLADVHYAVGMLDHCHGRSPALQFQTCRRTEQTFAEANRFHRLLFALAKPWR